MRRSLTRPWCSAAAAALLFGTACTSVPTSGEATEVGPAPREGAVRDTVDTARRVAARVREGATPVEVVDGFLSAQADTTPDGIVIAQEYLSITDDRAWAAEDETLIYTGKEVANEEVVSERARRVRIAYSLVARINSYGEYRPDARRFEETFDVADIAGRGWRISAGPHGRRISSSDMTQVFDRVVPYHYSTLDYDTLVPEPIYQLKEGTKRVTAAVKRLIDGPNPVMRDFAPEPLFPPGTRILAAPEPENGIAELSFSSELDGVGSTEEKRRKIAAQLVWTLTSMDSRITAVTIKVGDRAIDVGDLGTADALRQAQFQEFDPDKMYAERPTYFNLAGDLGRYRTSTSVTRGPSVSAGGGQPAVDPTGTTLAVVAQADKLQQLRVGPVAAGPLPTQLEFEHMTKPSWYEVDGAWVVGQTSGDLPVVYAVPPGADEIKKVDAHELNSRVLSFEVAPDGLRVAAIIERGGRNWLQIGYISRPSFTRVATRVGGFRTVVDGSAVSAFSVVWLDSGKLAFVGGQGDEDPEVFTVLVDGSDRQPVDSVTAKRSQRLLQSRRSESATAFQLIALPTRNDSARRGRNTPTAVMLVIDTEKIHINLGLGWTQLASPPRSSSPPSTSPTPSTSASPSSRPSPSGTASPSTTASPSPDQP